MEPDVHQDSSLDPSRNQTIREVVVIGHEIGYKGQEVRMTLDFDSL